MADLTAPTAQSMKIKYPEFEDVTDAAIELAIDDAASHVDDTWGNYRMEGHMAYAAHLIVSKIAAEDNVGGGFMTSLSLGRMALSFSAGQKPPSAGNPKTSVYGEHYIELCRALNPRVMVV